MSVGFIDSSRACPGTFRLLVLLRDRRAENGRLAFPIPDGSACYSPTPRQILVTPIVKSHRCAVALPSLSRMVDEPLAASQPGALSLREKPAPSGLYWPCVRVWIVRAYEDCAAHNN